MSARVTEARRLLRDAQVAQPGKPLYTGEAESIAAAQVLATLEVAEQQRIANLIALAKYEHADGSRGYQHAINHPVNEFDVALNAEIKKGLKL